MSVLNCAGNNRGNRRQAASPANCRGGFLFGVLFQRRKGALARLATLIDGIVNPRDKRAVIEWCAGPLMRAAPPAVWQPEAKITRQRQRTHLGQAALAFSYFQARWRAFPKNWRQIARRDCRSVVMGTTCGARGCRRLLLRRCARAVSRKSGNWQCCQIRFSRKWTPSFPWRRL